MATYKEGDRLVIELKERGADILNEFGDDLTRNYTVIEHTPAPEKVVWFSNVYNVAEHNGWGTLEDANSNAGTARRACLKLTYDPVTSTASAEVVE